MEVIDFGKMTKKKRQGVAPQAPAQSISATNSSTNHSFVGGKSREQGVMGMTQGSKGWQSQFVPQVQQPNIGNGQRNAIINSLTRSSSMTMPKIQHSLLTNEGFNEALQVVGARNNAKLDMQKRRALSGVLGSIIAGDASRYGADRRFESRAMGDATRRRGQDIDATYKTNALDETKAYHKILGNYYSGQNRIGEERNEIQREKLTSPVSGSKKLNPIDAQIKRQEIIAGVSKTGDGAKQIFGNEYDGLSDELKNGVQKRFITTGEMPTGYRQVSDGGWFGNPTYEPVYGKQEQTQSTTQQPQAQQQQTEQKSQQQVTGKLLDTVSSKLGIDRANIKISDDGSSIVFPDGSTAPVSELSKLYGA